MSRPLNDFAEAAIELAKINAGLEDRLTRSLEGLKPYSSVYLDLDIRDLAQSEVQFEDPLRASLAELPESPGGATE